MNLLYIYRAPRNENQKHELRLHRDLIQTIPQVGSLCNLLYQYLIRTKSPHDFLLSLTANVLVTVCEVYGKQKTEAVCSSENFVPFVYFSTQTTTSIVMAKETSYKLQHKLCARFVCSRPSAYLLSTSSFIVTYPILHSNK